MWVCWRRGRRWKLFLSFFFPRLSSLPGPRTRGKKVYKKSCYIKEETCKVRREGKWNSGRALAGVQTQGQGNWINCCRVVGEGEARAAAAASAWGRSRFLICLLSRPSERGTINSPFSRSRGVQIANAMRVVDVTSALRLIGVKATLRHVTWRWRYVGGSVASVV